MIHFAHDQYKTYNNHNNNNIQNIIISICVQSETTHAKVFI